MTNAGKTRTVATTVLLCMVPLMGLAAEVSDSQKEAEDRAINGAITYIGDSSMPYAGVKVMPDGTVVGSRITNHGRGVKQTLKMPNFSDVSPKYDPIIGKDQEGNPISAREKQLHDLQWKTIGKMVKAYNDGVKDGSIKPVDVAKESQLEIWKRQAQEAAEYEKTHGPIQTSKNFKIPGLTPEDSWLIKNSRTQIRFKNGQPEYLILDEAGNLKQIIRPRTEKPYEAKFKKEEPVRRKLQSKILYSSDESVDITDVNNPETKRIKALFPDIGKTPEQKRYIIREWKDDSAPRGGRR